MALWLRLTTSEWQGLIREEQSEGSRNANLRADEQDIVTILERKSRLYLAMKVDSKSAEDVTRATIALLMPYKEHVHTITADNGREFANHEEIAKVLDAKVYFAHPYSSWERGANENANGLLRQYVPKGTDLRLVSNELVALALSRINYRPKKCLGFKQPAKVFEEMRLAA